MTRTTPKETKYLTGTEKQFAIRRKDGAEAGKTKNKDIEDENREG